MVVRRQILVVDDDPVFHDIYTLNLAERGIEIFSALTLGQGFELFLMNQNEFDGIVMDACVPGREPTTVPLVQEIRARGFRGPIIAASSIDRYRELLLAAGASHQAEKHHVHEVLLAALGIAL